MVINCLNVSCFYLDRRQSLTFQLSLLHSSSCHTSSPIAECASLHQKQNSHSQRQLDPGGELVMDVEVEAAAAAALVTLLELVLIDRALPVTSNSKPILSTRTKPICLLESTASQTLSIYLIPRRRLRLVTQQMILPSEE